MKCWPIKEFFETNLNDLCSIKSIQHCKNNVQTLKMTFTEITQVRVGTEQNVNTVIHF